MNAVIRLAGMLTMSSGVALAATPARPPITGVSHIAVYASDPVKSERFYTHDLGGVKGEDPENPRGARYYFASTQFVEVLPLPPGAGIDQPAGSCRLFHDRCAGSARIFALEKHRSARQRATGQRWQSVVRCD